MLKDNIEIKYKMVQNEQMWIQENHKLYVIKYLKIIEKIKVKIKIENLESYLNGWILMSELTRNNKISSISFVYFPCIHINNIHILNYSSFQNIFRWHVCSYLQITCSNG